MTSTLLPFLSVTVVTLAAVALVLYVWTYVRHVALADARRTGCPGCPDRLAFA